ncbi:phage tail tape measure protein [Hafnia alvei]|uniref:phage tail tape measure protein n=1 Tax=Hafnia alvei TaxID=569 RepID=UPI001E607935|nr:phage tail tape measure protein [Hafnia alvei]
MSDRSLNIQVTFSALNKLSQPVNAARNAAAALATQIKATQGNIRALERQANTFDKLTQASKKTASGLEEAKQRAQAMRQEFDAAGERTEEQTACLEKQRKVIGLLTAQQSKEVKKLSELSEAFSREGIAIAHDSTAMQAITQRTEQYNQQLSEQQRRLTAVTQAQARNSLAQERAGKLKGAGMSTAFTGVAIGAPVVKAAMAYSSLEDAMKGVSKQVNGLTDSKGNRTGRYGEMQKTIMARGERSAMAGGSEDFAALVEGGARMGVANSADPWVKQKADLLAFADTAAKASIAFELPADELSESLGKIAGLYKVPTKNIEQLGDALNYLDDNAKSKGADIIDVMQRIGGVADKLDYRKAAVLGSTMLSLGTAPEVAASSIKAMVRELSNATVQGQRFFTGLDALGLDAKKVQDSMSRDAMGTITAILEKVHTLKDTDQTPILTQLFGKEFGSDVSKLTNNLDELHRQLGLVQGTAANGSMQRESDINKNSLSARYNMAKTSLSNAGASLGETLRGPLISLMGSVQHLMDSVQQWTAANPRLAASLMKIVAALGVLLTVLGGLMLIAGTILGPLALLRLSLTLLAGEEGALGAAGAIKSLSASLFDLMPNLSNVGTSIRDWGPIFESIATKAGVMKAAISDGLASMGEKLAGFILSPLDAVGALFSGLKSLFVMGVGGLVEGLASAFSLLLSPVGLFVGALVVGAVLVYKYWDQISAFFSGYFAEVMKGLQPLIDAFSPLIDMLKNVWNWFVKLLSPVKASAEQLDTCKEAGRSFGSVVGAGLKLLLTPLTLVGNAISWILEKLDLIPDAAERAAEAAKNVTLTDKANTLLSDMNAVTAAGKKQDDQAKKAAAGKKALRMVRLNSVL